LKIGLKARLSSKNSLTEEERRSAAPRASPHREHKPKGVLHAVLIPWSALPVKRSPLTSGLSESPHGVLSTPPWI